MADQKFEMLFWKGYPPSQGWYPGFNPRTEKAKGMIIERDVAVTMSDGIKIYVDIFRPEKEGKYPVLVSWGPYGKHGRYPLYAPSADVRHDLSEYTVFEAADPVYWCENGYIIINPDPRGAWNSEGDLTFFTDQEAKDCAELIEWAGTQSWSNGKVGMYGVSYLAWSQWRVAALNPPHLAAINPWEGVSDFYREFCFHGGIPETAFLARLRDGGWSYTTTGWKILWGWLSGIRCLMTTGPARTPICQRSRCPPLSSRAGLTMACIRAGHSKVSSRSLPRTSGLWSTGERSGTRFMNKKTWRDRDSFSISS